MPENAAGGLQTYPKYVWEVVQKRTSTRFFRRSVDTERRQNINHTFSCPALKKARGVLLEPVPGFTGGRGYTPRQALDRHILGLHTCWCRTGFCHDCFPSRTRPTSPHAKADGLVGWPRRGEAAALNRAFSRRLCGKTRTTRVRLKRTCSVWLLRFWAFGVACILHVKPPVLHPNITLGPTIAACNRSSAFCLLKLRGPGPLFAAIFAATQPRRRVSLCETLLAAPLAINLHVQTSIQRMPFSHFKVGVLNRDVQAIFKCLLLRCACCRWCSSGVFVFFSHRIPRSHCRRSSASLLLLYFIHHSRQNNISDDTCLQVQQKPTVIPTLLHWNDCCGANGQPE